MPPDAPKEESGVYTMWMGSEQRGKLMRMQGYCLKNGVRANGGTILRCLLAKAPEESSELLALVRMQVEKEKAEKLEKFQAATKGKKRGSRGKGRKD